MTGENVKDLRLMLDMVSKDFKRLSDDIKVLGDYLKPLQVELMLKEGEDEKTEV
jgi:hypothetical protein